MSIAKSASSRLRNVELIQTYYEGKKSPAKKEVVIFPQRNRILSSNLLSVMNLLLILTAVVAGVSLTHNRGAKAISLSSVKHKGGISYFDYGMIKNNASTLELAGGISCIAVNFEKPSDLTAAVISFQAKAEADREKLAIILRDAGNFSNANKDDVILTPVIPKNKWQAFNIRLKDISLPVDKSRVTQIRFDVSSALTGNESSKTVYIKNIVTE